MYFASCRLLFIELLSIGVKLSPCKLSFEFLSFFDHTSVDVGNVNERRTSVVEISARMTANLTSFHS